MKISKNHSNIILMISHIFPNRPHIGDKKSQLEPRRLDLSTQFWRENLKFQGLMRTMRERDVPLRQTPVMRMPVRKLETLFFRLEELLSSLITSDRSRGTMWSQDCPLTTRLGLELARDPSSPQPALLNPPPGNVMSNLRRSARRPQGRTVNR